jgi:hypothetical protein
MMRQLPGLVAIAFGMWAHATSRELVEWRQEGGGSMNVSNWTQADSDEAQRLWSEYEDGHDLSDREGQTAGIDPATGRIWFGNSIQDVVAKRDADGSQAQLYFVRVGSPTYYRKGGHR